MQLTSKEWHSCINPQKNLKNSATITGLSQGNSTSFWQFKSSNPALTFNFWAGLQMKSTCSAMRDNNVAWITCMDQRIGKVDCSSTCVWHLWLVPADNDIQLQSLDFQSQLVTLPTRHITNCLFQTTVNSSQSNHHKKCTSCRSSHHKQLKGHSNLTD